MTAYEKPSLNEENVARLLEELYGMLIEDVSPVGGGNLSSVFFFQKGGNAFVIRFSDLEGAYARERCVSRLLASQGVPYPKALEEGRYGSLTYSVSERLPGGMLADLPDAQKGSLLPDLVRVVTKMNFADVARTRGFGWLDADGNGTYDTWQQYIADFYKEDQTGTFWENWTDLFRSTCLEKEVFDECYARLMAFAPYNAPHRHFVHNDCHAWNMLTDGRSITGIIDANGLYGDFLIDLSIAETAVPGHDVIAAFREYHDRQGIAVPDFKERMLGARYYKGLDAMRFYAKMGWQDAYRHTRDRLLYLTN
ncbi:phosphotransferase family protein [Paenibacillus arenilitoris]|uniref:Aminoglycoside phosphotransferase family protein n=1 Tax=Paenibacillus arenilitoris TaxID=2772299 RepID=A0A927H7K9_9BACL|nr:aminoglycoside phosphotransferase family protein [Paenibacillus arenilitoris]MBD2870647.1 aminoglycoside phosphotransferase family protein [Paenibacillus arenilitoris]